MAHILIVDNDDGLVNVLQELVELSGHTATCFLHVNEAFAYLQEPIRQVDGIICDWFLDSMTGKEFLERLADHPEWNKIPVFLVTGSIGLQVYRTAAQFDVHSVIEKPFHLEDVKSMLSSIFTLR